MSSLLAPWNAYVDFLRWVLEGISEMVGSGGLAIVIFTIIVKTILLPLTLKSIRSMKAMQDIQPKIKELQKKHGKNREELQKQTMALYAAHQVNPVAGCLPMLIQIPIFFGVYHAITGLSGDNATGNFATSFLWLPSLGDADPYFILPIAAGVFQFIQMRMSRPRIAPATNDPQTQIMNTMMNIMPLMVIVFGWTFASGAVLYWATQSIYSAVQQWFVSGWGQLKNYAEWLPEMPEHRRLGYVAPRNLDDVVVEYGANGRPKAGGLMGKMQARLEEAQKLQEERQAQLKGTTTPASATTGRPVTAKTGTARTSAAKTGAAGATASAADATGTATVGSTARPRAGQRGSRKRTAAQRSSSARPAMATDVTTPDIVEAEVTAVEDVAPAQPAMSSASYANRVSAASRRGPKSSWGSAGSAPLAGAGGNTDAGED